MNQSNTTGEFTPKKIQDILKARKITQKRLAEELDASEMSISDVINFRMVSSRLMEGIAKRINADPKDVFAWYFRQDRPRRPSKRR